MFDFDALCPNCDGKFKLSMIGLETKEFIQCPLCRRLIKLDLADPEKKAIRVPDCVDWFLASNPIVSWEGKKRVGFTRQKLWFSYGWVKSHIPLREITTSSSQSPVSRSGSGEIPIIEWAVRMFLKFDDWTPLGVSILHEYEQNLQIFF